MLDGKIGFGGALASYPCVAILCTMGSTHVVTFRAHTAIMLILTLTISAFDPEDSTNGSSSGVAGDYSAVFPLLVVSVFVALMVSRQTVFYKAQRSRVDISARPEVLCQPGQEGMPVVVNYDGGDESQYDYDDYGSDVSGSGYLSEEDAVGLELSKENKVTQDDIEKEFSAYSVGTMAKSGANEPTVATKKDVFTSSSRSGRQNSSDQQGSRGTSPLPPRPKNTSGELKSSSQTSSATTGLGDLSSSRLDELLAKPMDNPRPTKPRHRRIQSAPNVDFGTGRKFQRDRAGSSGDGGVASAGGGGRHGRSDSFGSQASFKRVTTIGNLSLEQPSLMDQARLRSATSVIVESRHVRNPSLPTRIGRRGHSRQSSASSIGGASTSPPLQVTASSEKISLSSTDVERAYTSAVNQQRAGRGSTGRTADGSARGKASN